MLKPRKNVPDLEVSLLDGSIWKLSQQKPKVFSLIVFYRGFHCPICRKYLKQLADIVSQYEGLGIEVLVLSSDTRERAEQTMKVSNLDTLEIGYGISISEGRKWGLFVSSSRGKTSLGVEEPAEFLEPGLFLVTPEKTLYASAIQTMPFARPDFVSLLTSLKFIIENNYPARGDL